MDAIKLARATAVLWVLLAATLPAAADQTDPRLPGLFEQLKAATSDLTAAAIERDIWGTWTESGNTEGDALMQAGAAALARQDGEKALYAFTRLTVLLPNFAEGWNKRATTLYLLGRFAASKADIAKVLALEPRHFGALSGLGLCEAELDHLPEAITALQRALAVNPNMPGVQFNLKNLQAELEKRSI